MDGDQIDQGTMKLPINISVMANVENNLGDQDDSNCS